jgi:predicted small lipoprotein YifL
MTSRSVLPILLLAVAVALAGCGRKGRLEPPGGAPATSAVPTVFGTSPAAAPPVEPARPDKPFVLDAII